MYGNINKYILRKAKQALDLVPYKTARAEEKKCVQSFVFVSCNHT